MCATCGTERSRATGLSLFPDKEQVKSVLSLQLQEPQPYAQEIQADFQMLITLPGGVPDPTEGLRQSASAPWAEPHISPTQLDIVFLYKAEKRNEKQRQGEGEREIVHTSIVQPVAGNKESPPSNLVLMNHDINHCKLCLFTLILGV